MPNMVFCSRFLVAPMEDGSGNYLLIAGERRLRASKMAALSEIPVIISDYTQQQIAEIALIENLQREDLHYLEEAEGSKMLMNEFHLTQDSMAARVGKKTVELLPISCVYCVCRSLYASLCAKMP